VREIREKIDEKLTNNNTRYYRDSAVMIGNFLILRSTNIREINKYRKKRVYSN